MTTITRMGRRPKDAPAPEPLEKYTTTLPAEMLIWAREHFGPRGLGPWILGKLIEERTRVEDAELLARAKAAKKGGVE